MVPTDKAAEIAGTDSVRMTPALTSTQCCKTAGIRQVEGLKTCGAPNQAVCGMIRSREARTELESNLCHWYGTAELHGRVLADWWKCRC